MSAGGGWGVIRPGNRRAHYYRDMTPVCGNDGPYADFPYTGPLDAGDIPARSCAACREKITAEQMRPGWLKPCGTPAAARRHYRRGEPLDAACRAVEHRRLAGNASEMSPDYRETRNGLPEFRPYVYRGTGEDQLEAAS
jgi:hypothetical protein